MPEQKIVNLPERKPDGDWLEKRIHDPEPAKDKPTVPPPPPPPGGKRK